MTAIAVSTFPVIDLTGLRAGNVPSPSDLHRIADAIRAACTGPGFFYVTAHGVPQALVRRAFSLSRDFFASSLQAKQALSIERSPHMRGYFALESESPEYEALGDLKEGFDLSLDLPQGSPRSASRLYGPNVWPASPADFRAVMTAYHAEMLSLGRDLLRAFAVGLERPPSAFESAFSLPLAQLRLLHYPPQPGAVTRHQMGAGEHTDFGCLTLLAQDDVGGLQVRTAAGDWVAMPPLADAFIVNVGDLMTIWSGGRYRATWHRVVNQAPRDRYSIAFFLDPNAEVDVVPMTGDGAAAGDPVNVDRYMNQRFDATFGFRAATPGQGGGAADAALAGESRHVG